MTDDNDSNEFSSVHSSRRTFLKATSAAGFFGGMGSVTACQSGDSKSGSKPGSGTKSNRGSSPLHDDYVYNWKAATLDAYWYSLYNLAASLTFSGNGVRLKQIVPQKRIQKRKQQMLKVAGLKKPPVKSPNLVVAPYTTGDPHYTQKPDFKPPVNANTRTWDLSKSSRTVSPASVAWPQLKAVTWAKNFQNHFGALPLTDKQQFRTMKLGTLTQMSIKWALIKGKLRKNNDNMLLVSEFDPKAGKVVDGTAKPDQHAAMLWFLSDMVSFAKNGWYGYENPKPLIPPAKIQQLTDKLGQTIMSEFPADSIVDDQNTRTVGLMLGGMGWFGTHAGSDKLTDRAAEYANSLAGVVADHLEDNGKVGGGTENQAATQGVVGQGLLWASQLDGVSYEDRARSVLAYMFDELWDEDAGTFASGTDDGTYTVTVRDAGDVTGGINAADAVLGMEQAQEIFPTYFDNTFNRGRLMRAQLKNSRHPAKEYVLPLPPKAGGKFGQAPVYNAAVEYDTNADEWFVADDTFLAGDAIYLANQDVWIGNWSGGFYHGRGIPGKTDKPVN